MQNGSQIGASEGRDFHIIRLGYQDRANLLPLVYPLSAGWTAPPSPWKLEVTTSTAPALADELLNDRLDAAFISPATLMQNSGRLAPVGAWGLASDDGTSSTALLLAPKRLDEMDGAQVAVAPSAQGSTAEHLLKTLLKPYYDLSLNLVPADEPSSTETRLLYDDKAAREARKLPQGWVAEDVGRAWWIMTGQPVVWEMLAVPRDLESRRPGATQALQELLQQSQRTAREQQAAILEEATGRLGMKRDEVKALFARQRYILTENEQKGLAYFLDTATRAGVLVT